MKDNLLYVNARGLQLVYNAFMIAILWITRGWQCQFLSMLSCWRWFCLPSAATNANR